MKTPRLTIYDIKMRTQETSPHFFTRSTLKFFHQRLKDFSVINLGGGLYRISAPMFDSYGRNVGETVRIFNSATNELIRES